MIWVLVVVHLLKVNPHVEMIGVFETQEVCNVAVDNYKNVSNRFEKNTAAVCILTEKGHSVRFINTYIYFL